MALHKCGHLWNRAKRFPMYKTLLIFLLCLPVFSASEEPVKKIPLTAEKATSSNRVATKSVDQKSVVQNIVPPVTVLGSDTTNAHPSNVKQGSQHESINFAEWLVAIATTALALITLRLVHYTRKLWRSTSDLVEMSEQTNKAIERAYVFPEIHIGDGPRYSLTGNMPWNIDVKYWNSGKTPAILRLLRCESIIAPVFETPEELNKNPIANNEIAPGMAIPSETAYEGLAPINLTSAQWGDVERKNLTVYVIGLVEYDEVFGERRKTGFCYQHQRVNHQDTFIISPRTKLNYYT